MLLDATRPRQAFLRRPIPGDGVFAEAAAAMGARLGGSRALIGLVASERIRPVGLAVLGVFVLAWALTSAGPIGALVALGAIAALAYACRARVAVRGATSVPRVERVGGCGLGPREAVHLVRVGDTVLVLGVTPSSVTLLATDPIVVATRPSDGQGVGDERGEQRAEPTLPARSPAPIHVDAGSFLASLRDSAKMLGRVAGVVLLVSSVSLAAPSPQRTGEPGESTSQIAGSGQARSGAQPAPPPNDAQQPPALPFRFGAPSDRQPGHVQAVPDAGNGTLVWLALFALLPFVLMATTSFVKVSVVLSLLRNAIGTPQAPSDPVLAGIALALTTFVMAPVTREVTARLEGRTGELQTVAGSLAVLSTAAEPIRAFLLRNTRPDEIALFVDVSARPGAEPAEPESFPVLMPAFVTSELREAFVVGFLIFLPFLVVDLVVANILMSMGMVMVSPAGVALPFKILLFVLIDGWPLLMKGLALSYR